MRSVLMSALAVASLTAMVPVLAAEDFDRAIIAIEAYDYPRALPPLRAAVDDTWTMLPPRPP